jgi:hypothetical protein
MATVHTTEAGDYMALLSRPPDVSLLVNPEAAR